MGETMTSMLETLFRKGPIPSCIAVLCRQSPTIQSQSDTQSASIYSRDVRSKLASHLLRSRKSSEKLGFNVEHAAISLHNVYKSPQSERL
jgi:hypothetical protein